MKGSRGTKPTDPRHDPTATEREKKERKEERGDSYSVEARKPRALFGARGFSDIFRLLPLNGFAVVGGESEMRYAIHGFVCQIRLSFANVFNAPLI